MHMKFCGLAVNYLNGGSRAVINFLHIHFDCETDKAIMIVKQYNNNNPIWCLVMLYVLLKRFNLLTCALQQETVVTTEQVEYGKIAQVYCNIAML